jgi:hypothetical protein
MAPSPARNPERSGDQLFTFAPIEPIIIHMRGRLRSVLFVSAVIGTILGLLLAGMVLNVHDRFTRGRSEQGWRLRCPSCKRLHKKVWKKLPPPDDAAWTCKNVAKHAKPVRRKEELA